MRTKDEILEYIDKYNVDPSFLGKCAHKIEDFQIIGLRLFCKTKRFDWHRGTEREKAIVRGYGFTCI